jgi:Reverse transcriptase (RNA-dependent DNA polymerase)
MCAFSDARKLLAKECRLVIHDFYVDRENRIINSDNLGKFYNYANSKFTCKSSVGPLKSADGTLSTDPIVKTELLQSVFSSAFTADNGFILPLSTSTSPPTKLSTIIFTPTLVKRVINGINGKAKGGPDDIPPLFYKKCANPLASPLAFLFNHCMASNYIPPVWLHAFITPIFKKGDPTDPHNYRPIALTCTLCKIMEAIIKDQILDFLLSKNIISKHQHGFLRKHSTTTNLLESTHDWIVGLGCANNIDVVYIDFSKAFDSIVFSKLLFKLQNCGISGRLLAWLSSFIHGRSQCVVLENCFSTVSYVISGVPQGSVLGPILFLVFINDVISICCGDTIVKLFADDLKLYSIFNRTDYSSDLQHSIDELFKWSNLWQLQINLNKCQVLKIRTKCNSVVSSHYSLNDFVLSNVKLVNDLGVYVDSNLSFKHHIATVVTKARQRAGVFFRGFASRSLDIVRKTFVTYIRPILEYNSNVWNPTHKYLIDQIENVQRKFTKRISSISNLSYLERLSILELETLELRRLRFDLVQYYKIFNNLTSLCPADFFNVHQPTLSSRAPAPTLLKPLNTPNYVLSTFFYRSLDSWNSLPLHMKQCTSLNMFKSNIKSVDLNRFLKGHAFKLS